MACPHVSGAAALIFEEVGSNFTPEEVQDKLYLKSAEGYISDLKHGDINSLVHVGPAKPPKGDVPMPSPPDCPGWCTVCIVSTCNGCC